MQTNLRSHMLQTRIGAFGALAVFGLAAAPAAHAQQSFQATRTHSGTMPLTPGSVSRRIIPVGKDQKKKAAAVSRWIACKWDMVGVVGLMLSSAAYGIYALAHTGL